MGIEKADSCMDCHKKVKPDSAAIKQLSLLAKKKRDVAWVPVYHVPSFVRFSHSSHAGAGVHCDECHGPVPTRDELFPEKDMSQKGCLACHAQYHVGARIDGGINCFFCHD